MPGTLFWRQNVKFANATRDVYLHGYPKMHNRELFALFLPRRQVIFYHFVQSTSILEERRGIQESAQTFPLFAQHVSRLTILTRFSIIFREIAQGMVDASPINGNTDSTNISNTENYCFCRKRRVVVIKKCQEIKRSTEMLEKIKNHIFCTVPMHIERNYTKHS